MSDERGARDEADEPQCELEAVADARVVPFRDEPSDPRRRHQRAGPTLRVANPEQETGGREGPAGAELGHCSKRRLAGEGPDRVVSRRGEAQDPDDERNEAREDLRVPAERM
jgi:hypothetical protein